MIHHHSQSIHFPFVTLCVGREAYSLTGVLNPKLSGLELLLTGGIAAGKAFGKVDEFVYSHSLNDL